MNAAPTHLLVGEIRKPHGIRGEVYVVPTTDNVAEIYTPGRELYLADAAGVPLDPDLGLVVVRAREFKKGLIVEFEDVVDRNAAELLRGRMLAVAAEDVPPLEDEEFFLHDLIDLEVRGLDGSVLGRVDRIYTVGASHLLGVDDGERERLVPFSREIVRSVELEDGFIVIEPTPGLMEI